MQPFIQTLFTMTVAATVAAVVVMILRLPLKKAPRWITCALWLVVFLRMVCPVSLDLPVSLMPAQVTSGAAAERVLPAPAPTPLEPTEAVTEPPLESSDVVEPTEPMAPTPNDPDRYAVLTLIWAAGAAGMGLWAVASYLRLRRRVADGVLVSENVYETDRVDSPFVCGFFKPRIYLPVGLAQEDKAYVLLHEQAHLRRRDHLTKPLGWLALCLHWFNPVLWVAYRLFCRDVEAACDQSVVKDFDKTDTAGYAAALLHLGRKPSLPQAVPLAFGEENAKGRIQGVLNYKNPRLWVAVVAIVVCVVTGVLILANPGQAAETGSVDHRLGPQLEGVSITAGYLVNQGAFLDCPEDLQKDLAVLLAKHGHGDYVSLDNIPAFPDDTIWLQSHNDGTSFYFDPASLTLTRVNQDTYSQPVKQAAVKATLAEDPDYLAWKDALTDYQRYARADSLYALKTPYIGDPVADSDILRCAEAYRAGRFTIELQTAAEPYGITLHLEALRPFAQEQAQAMDYLQKVGVLFLALVDNAGTFTVSYESPFDSVGFTVEADPAHKDLTQEEFRVLYDQVCTGPIPGFYWGYTVTEALYLAPETKNFPPESTFGSFTITGSTFSAKVGNLISSAWPKSDLYESVLYRNSDDRSPIVAQDGTTFDLSSYQAVDVVSVCDSDAQDTGYRIYRLDNETWVGHWTEDNQLEYLVKVEPTAY